MTKDFTLCKYRELCESLLAFDYSPLTIYGYFEGKLASRPVLMRHDVDRKPANALKIASAEHDLGISSTFYFRHVPGVFQPEIIQEIASLGHEIGYHYETLSKAGGDCAKAIELFETELADFRRYVPVVTISMHGRPFSRWDNRTLWQQYDLGQFGLIGECYLDIDYTRVTYLSDTGRTWHPGRFNIRDHVAGESPTHLETTDDLIAYLPIFKGECLCLLTHPNRWADSTGEWLRENTIDWLINNAKRILIMLRNKGN